MGDFSGGAFVVVFVFFALVFFSCSFSGVGISMGCSSSLFRASVSSCLVRFLDYFLWRPFLSPISWWRRLLWRIFSVFFWRSFSCFFLTSCLSKIGLSGVKSFMGKFSFFPCNYVLRRGRLGFLRFAITRRRSYHCALRGMLYAPTQTLHKALDVWQP